MQTHVNDQFLHLPKDHKAFIAQLKHFQEITPLAKLGGGSPDTAVYLVDLKKDSTGQAPGNWVLKVDVTRRARREAEKHEIIKKSSLSRYVPILQHKILSENDDDLSLLSYSLAAGSFLNNQTLESVISQKVTYPSDILKKLSTALLIEWNFQNTPKTMTIIDAIRTDLIGVIESVEDLSNRIIDICDNSKRRIEGGPITGWMINPIHYLLNGIKTAKPLTCTVPLGHVHGDLHPGNILVPKPSSFSHSHHPPFSIIDFAFYRKGNIFFDLAYIELAIFSIRFDFFKSSIDRNLWWGLEQYLRSALYPQKQFDNTPQVNSVRDLALSIRKPIRELADRDNRADDYWVAYLAASIAAAMTLSLNPERIAKDTSKQSFLRVAALFTAASRLQKVFEVFSMDKDLGVLSGKEPPFQIVWPQSNFGNLSITDSSNIDQRETFNRIAKDLLGSLRNSRCILFVGDMFAKDLCDIPEDGKLARQVVEKLNLPPPKALGGESNIAAMDWLEGDEGAIKHAIMECLHSIHPIENEYYKHLALIKWAAIVDWSFSSGFHDKLKSIPGLSPDIKGIHCHAPTDIDFHSLAFIPFFHLRGTTDEFKNLALGIRGYDRQRNARLSILKSLFRALPFDPTLIFLGFEKATFEMLRNDINDLIGPKNVVWVFRPKFSNEEILTLEKSRGYKVVELSSQAFVEFCSYVAKQSSDDESIKEDIILDVKGVELVNQEDGTISFRRSQDAQRKERIFISKEDYIKIDRHIEFLHSNIVHKENVSDRSPGDFYRGNIPLWRELGQNLAIWRKIPGDEMLKSILNDLEEMDPRRISLWYQAGSGATTLLRQLAYKIYSDENIPTAIFRRYTRDTYGEVIRYYNQFRRSFVLFVDEQEVSRGDGDMLFGQLQERRVPVVLIYAARSNHSRNALKQAVGQSFLGRKRRFYLIDEIYKDGKDELETHLRPFLGSDELTRFIKCEHKSLFLILLETFEDKFVKLEEVVSAILNGAENHVKELIAAIGSLHYFGHRSTPATVLEHISKLSFEDICSKLDPFEERLLWRMKENGETAWYPRHYLIAEALLSLAFGSNRLIGTPLKKYALDLIEKLGVPDAAPDIFQKLIWALVGAD